MKYSEILKGLNYLIVYLLIAVSTIPFFKDSIGFYLATLLMVLNYKRFFGIFKIEIKLIIALIFFLEVYHFFFFENYEIWVIRQILFYFILAAFCVNNVKSNFFTMYINILYYTLLISFVFYFTLLISPSLITIVENATPSFFVKTSTFYNETTSKINPIVFNFDYNFHKGRNNGPFWEPTVFSSLLIIGQMFNLLINKKLFNKLGIIFTIGIVTTLSTTGFGAYFMLVFFYLLTDEKIGLWYKTALSSISLMLGLFLFSNLSFLEEKINGEILGVQQSIYDRGGDSRLASAILDMTEVSKDVKYLVLGKGSSKYSRIGSYDKNVLRNCGLTAIIVEWGVIIAIIYLCLIYYSFYQMTVYFKTKKLFALVFTLILMVLSFSEVFFDLPLFHAFIFLGFMLKREMKNIKPNANHSFKNKSITF